MTTGSTDHPISAPDVAFECIQVHHLDAGHGQSVVHLVLNRPQARNAMSLAMIRELSRAFEGLRKDPHLRVLVLSGAGGNFCAGADLRWMIDAATLSEGANLREAQELYDMFEELHGIRCPVVAAVEGAAFAGALGLCALADIVIATTASTFALSEVRLGLLPAIIMPYLGRRLGPGPLRRLVLTGARLSGPEAHAIGLVDRLSPTSQDLAQATDAEVQTLLGGAPLAQRNAKRLLQTLTDQGMRQSDLTYTTLAGARVSPEAVAGLQAFVAKRAPPWGTTDLRPGALAASILGSAP